MKIYLDTPLEVELIKDQFDNGQVGPCSADKLSYQVEPADHAEATAVGSKVRVVGKKPGPCRMRGVATYSDGIARETNWIEVQVEELPVKEVPVPSQLTGPALIDPFAG